MSGGDGIDDLLASDEPADRLEAIDSLHARPRRVAVPVLLEALSDPDEEVSGRAADGLGRLGTTETVPALVREYVRPDRYPGTYVYDVPHFTALDRLGADDAWEPLVGALESATERETVSRCVLLLQRLRDQRARPELERLVDVGESHEDDVLAIARGAERVLDRLDEVVARTGELRTLDDVRRALDAEEYDEGEAGKLRLAQWVREADTDALCEALRDPRNVVSSEAADALGVRGATEAVPGLVREVPREERNLASSVAEYQFAEETDLAHGEHARALVRVDDRSAVEPLLDALEAAHDPWVRWDVLWVLGWLGDPRALEAATEELNRLGGSGGAGWRHRALASNSEVAVARLRWAAEDE